MDSPEEWFNAVLLLEAQHRDETENADPLVERRVVLLRATSEAQAAKKAADICARLQEDYRNVHQKQVCWRCISVAAVTPLYVTTIEDGSEVYSEFLSPAAEL